VPNRSSVGLSRLILGAGVPASVCTISTIGRQKKGIEMRSVLFTGIVLALGGNAWGQFQYTVTDLGTLPGGLSSDATGINSTGQVVGYSTGSNGQPQAFLYSGGSMQGLGTFSPSQSCSVATGINSAGQIVGYTQSSYGAGYGAGPSYGFIYSGGTVTQIPSLGGVAYTFGNAINNAGQVAGLSLVSNSDVTDAYLYSGGTTTDLGNLSGGPGGYSDGYGINDHTQIVGNSTVPNSNGRERAFLWQNGTMSDLGDLYGGSANAWAYSINNLGQAVGDSWQVAPSSAHAFLWQSGTMTDLGTLPGGTFSQALNINNTGMIVGDAYTSSGAQHAFLYSDGSMQDLNNLIPSTSDWILEQANAINDNGQIVGYGVNPSGQTDAFLLTPTPEPCTLALLCVGAGVMVGWTWRQGRRNSDQLT